MSTFVSSLAKVDEPAQTARKSIDKDVLDVHTADVESTMESGEKRVDYSGFAQKTDPREIKLVRKLDMYIMISLWSMYWLNYLDR